MPSWPPRVRNRSSPTTDHTPDVLSSHNESFHNNYERDLERFVEASSYVSVAASPGSSECFHPVRHPGRDLSSSPHFLPSLAKDEKKWADGGTNKIRDGNRKGCDLTESRPLPANSPTASIQTMPSQQENTGLITGKCATCGSSVRWPRHLHVFRCTVCLMVNHLKLASAKPADEDGLRAELQVNMDEIETCNQKLGMSRGWDYLVSLLIVITVVPRISISKTKSIIQECISLYLKVRLSSLQRERRYEIRWDSPRNAVESKASLNNKKQKPKNVAASSQHESFLDTHVDKDSSTAKLCNFQILSPSSAPPPAPLINLNFPPEDAPDDTQTMGNLSDEVEYVKSIFDPLKSYITTCFLQCNCLNSSFLAPKAPYLRATSEGIASTTNFTSNLASWTDTEKLPPEPDTKILLLENLAENGTWWTGSAHVGPKVTSTISNKKPDRASAARVSLKTPRIHWEELSEWYHLILSAGCAWKGVLGKVEIKNSIGGIQKPYEMSVEEQQGIEQDIAHARDEVQRTLLEACENLLRRPGLPINEPQTCRFLLLLLANPIFNPTEYPSGSKQGAYTMRNIGQTSTSQIQQASSWKSTSMMRQNLNAEGRSSNTDTDNTNKHSSIIKRILGLISNLPVDCQYHITMWFSRFSKPHFLKTVELVGSFVSYRLSRQHRRKHSNRMNLVDGLISEVQRSRVSESAAQLRVAFSVSRNSEAFDKRRPTINYSEDWQIRAAARVMSLLFSANSSGPYRRQDDQSTSLEFSTADVCPSGPQHALRPKKIVETSMFYNTLLDHADLIADFETWETQTEKFAFCQYPMFLSIWAKIRLMGYDARRQMETKAREAFFDSIVSRKAVSQYLILKIRRECLVEDSLRGVSEVVGTGQEEIKKGLRIEFSDEEGIDAGGYAYPYQATASFSFYFQC